MRKLLTSIALMFCLCAQAQTDFTYGLANHLGVGLSAGTTGWGITASTCLTKYVSVRAGLNFMPGFKINNTFDIETSAQYGGETLRVDGQVEAKANLSRTTADLIFDVHPFGSGFFISAGFSFGGSTVMKVTGHSDEVKDLYAQYPQFRDQVKISDLEIPFDDNGDIRGGVKVSGFRPYLGIGFGPRAVPKSRVGFRTELGVQFHGKPKVYGGGNDDILNGEDIEGDSDIADIVNKITVYPVLRFTLVGRIL